ncbi:IclR family transcriptional regulator domain-containing protein [Brucella anthropi]|uniref:IclR-ED domain-containing protein n=1 Tax=Brucella anthropi TaxID=529 RepID=A0A6L3YZX6_BRUAN|nr:hypothetical protein F9L04_24630 [Brucella anthropi]
MHLLLRHRPLRHGRVLLPGSAEARKILIACDLVARTDRTLTDVDVLLGELEAIHRSGYAAVDQEVEASLRSVAVPLRNGRGKIVAALNVGLAASAETMTAVIGKFLPKLLRTQDELVQMIL